MRISSRLATGMFCGTPCILQYKEIWTMNMNSSQRKEVWFNNNLRYVIPFFLTRCHFKNILSLTYQRFTYSGCKDTDIREFEFVAKTQFLFWKLYSLQKYVYRYVDILITLYFNTIYDAHFMLVLCQWNRKGCTLFFLKNLFFQFFVIFLTTITEFYEYELTLSAIFNSFLNL